MPSNRQVSRNANNSNCNGNISPKDGDHQKIRIFRSENVVNLKMYLGHFRANKRDQRKGETFRMNNRARNCIQNETITIFRFSASFAFRKVFVSGPQFHILSKMKRSKCGCIAICVSLPRRTAGVANKIEFQANGNPLAERFLTVWLTPDWVCLCKSCKVFNNFRDIVSASTKVAFV